MAKYRAIKTACEGVLSLLKGNYRADDFDGVQLQFKVYQAQDFTLPMEAGISLFLYRIYLNDAHRTPAGRVGPQGQRYHSQLPLDLHFLLTAWGKDASLQHTITGWMMRTLEDTPVLPAGLLNSIDPDIFSQDETLEIIPAELNNEDMAGIWRDLLEYKYQLSIPYMARNVRIDSSLEVVEGTSIQERQLKFTPEL